MSLSFLEYQHHYRGPQTNIAGQNYSFDYCHILPILISYVFSYIFSNSSQSFLIRIDSSRSSLTMVEYSKWVYFKLNYRPSFYECTYLQINKLVYIDLLIDINKILCTYIVGRGRKYSQLQCPLKCKND